jgi:hypothetical protein
MATSELITPMFNEGGASGIGWSELDPLANCEKEHQYANVRQIYKPTAESPDALAVGAFVHAGRARWFADKQSTSAETWQRIVEDITRTREGLPLPCSESAERDALRYVQEFVEHYSVRAKPNIVAVEHMLGPVNIGGDDTPRTGRLDDFGFYPDAGDKLAIGECKTTHSITDTLMEYSLHGQPVLQRILWSLAPQGEATYGQVAGHVLDIIQKGYGGKKCSFMRIFVPLEPRVLEWGREYLVRLLNRRKEIGWDTPVVRNLKACTRLTGKARVACKFQNLCQYGKTAALEYAFRDGRGLPEHTPETGRETAPWD